VTERSFRAGIIGCGNVVLNAHIPALRLLPEIEAVCVADPVASLRESACQQLGLPPSAGYAGYLEMLAERQPDYVLLATPPSVRLEIVSHCARLGIHVLAEKPAAAVPHEADEQADRMRTAGLVFGYVHNYLFYPEYARLRRIVAEREIGDLRHAALNFLGVEDRPGNGAYRPGWRHDPAAGGGGVLMDMIHAIYLAEHLAGDEIRAVGAVVDNLGYPDGAVEDIALVQLHFENAYATIHMGWGSGPGGIELAGSEGRALVFYRDYRTGPFDHLECITLINADGRRDFRPQEQYDGTLNFVEIHRDFIGAIRDGRLPAAPASAANHSLEAALAAYQSAYQGRVIDLPLGKTDPVYLKGVAGLADLPGRPNNPITRRGLFLRSSGA
jgi:predicted dehydrogenase